MGQKIRIGPVFWVVGIILMAFLSFAAAYLMGLWDLIQIPFFFSLLGLVIVLLAGKVGHTSEGIFSIRILGAGVIGLVALALNEQIVGGILGFVPLSVAPLTDVALVNVLSAILEENFFLGIRAAGRAGNVPDWGIVGLSAFAFIPFHGLRHPVSAALYFFVLLGARIILDSISLATNHSDPPYIAHPIFNFVLSL